MANEPAPPPEAELFFGTEDIPPPPPEEELAGPTTLEIGIGAGQALLEAMASPVTAAARVAGPAAEAVVAEPEAVKRGLVSGLTFGTVQPGQPPTTPTGQAVEAGAAMVGSIPWAVASEAVATTMLARYGLSGLSQLSQHVLRATGAGAVFGAAEQVAQEGVSATAKEPLKLASEAAKTGLAWAPFGLASGYLAKFFEGTKALPPQQRQAMAQALVAEIEDMVHRPGPSKFKIMEAMRAANKRQTPFSTLLNEEEIAALQLNPAAHAEMEAIASGRASFRKEGQLAQALLGPRAEALPQPLVKVVEANPNLDFEHMGQAFKSAREHGIAVEGLLTSDELAAMKAQPAIRSLLEESAAQGIDFRSLLTKNERELLGIGARPQPLPWQLEWAPLAPEEAAAKPVYEGKIYSTEGDIFLEAKLRSRVIKAEPTPQASEAGLVEEVVAHRYKQEIGNARLHGREESLLEELQAIREKPAAWSEALSQYAQDAGYDALQIGNQTLLKNANNFELVLPKPVAQATAQALGVPELVPAELVSSLPEVRNALVSAPGAKESYLKRWSLKRQGERRSVVELGRELSRWARSRTAEERAIEFVDPEVQRVNQQLTKAGADIGYLHKGFGNLAAIADSFDKTGTLMRKLVYPHQVNEVRATQFARAVKENISAVIGFKPGSKESAIMQRVGERRMLPPDIPHDTPEMRAKILKVRRLYDWYLDNLNRIRLSIGEAEIPKRDDFFTHFNELGHVQRMFGNLTGKIEASAGKSFAKPTDPFFRSELERIGGAFMDDAIGGLELYTDGASRYMFLTESGARILENAKTMPKGLRETFEKAVAYSYGQQPEGGAIAKWFKEGYMGRGLRWLNRRVNTNQISANLGTGIVQSGSIPFIATQAGEANMVMALRDIYDPAVAVANRAMARRVSPAVASHSLESNEWNEGVVSNVGRFANLVVSGPDNEMSQLAFWAGINQAKAMGLAGEAAWVHANKIVNATNATYLRSNTPEFLRGVAAEMGLPFQRQMLSLANTLFVDMLKAPQLRMQAAEAFAVYSGARDTRAAAKAILAGMNQNRGNLRKAAWGMVRLEIYGVMMNATVGAVGQTMGLDTRDVWEPQNIVNPFYGMLKYGLKTPLMTQLGNVTKGKVLEPAVMAGAPFGGRQILNTMKGQPLGKPSK